MGNADLQDLDAFGMPASATVLPHLRGADELAADAQSKAFPSFIVVLLGLTALPFLLMPILSGKLPPGVEQTKQTILFLGQVHIALTALMYLDKDFGKIVAANHFRYYYLPAGAAVFFGLLFAAIPGKYQFAFWWIYSGWQNWHFGKQNIGVHAMCTVQEKSGGRMSQERALMNFANACAIVALTEAFTRSDVEFRAAFPLSYHSLELAADFARYGFALSLVGTVLVLFANRRTFGVLRAASLLAAVLFFCWPAYFSTDFTAAFVSVSIAHSLQYIAFMTVFWFNAPGLNSNRGVSKAAIFFLVAIVGGAILTIRGEFGPMIGDPLGLPSLSSFIFGFMFGLVVAHFIVDAHAWRLRDKPQRDFVRSRFPFVFDPH